MPALADQLSLFPTPEVPSHVAIFEIVDQAVVILASAPTPIPTTKNKVTFAPHRKGYLPQKEAVALARYVADRATREIVEV